MKRKLFVIILLILSSIQIWSQNSNNYKIMGTIIGAEKKKVFISLHNRNNPPIDSCTITNSSFTFTGNINETDYYRLYIEDKKGYKPFILSNTSIFVDGNADSIWMASVKDESENKYSSFLKIKLDSLKNTSSSPKEVDTNLKLDPAQILEMLTNVQKNGSVGDQTIPIRRDFILNNPNAFESLWQLIRYYKEFGEEQSNKLYNSLSNNLKAHTLAQTFKPIMIRQEEIDLKYLSTELMDPEDYCLNLDTLNWNYLLVEFWASWCGPCRQAIPGLKEIYKEYHSMGLEIVSVSIDESKDAWLKAINEENIKWYNLSDLKGFNKGIAKEYGITSIPISYLVNKSGEIVKVNPKEKDIAERLNLRE